MQPSSGVSTDSLTCVYARLEAYICCDPEYSRPDFLDRGRSRVSGRNGEIQ